MRVTHPRRVAHYTRYVVAAIIAVAFIAPFLWTVLVSVSDPADVYQFPPKLWPAFKFSNYAAAWQANPLWPRLFANTFFIAACVVALTVATSTLAGFAFAVMKFPGRRALFLLVMAVMMVPQTVLLIPNFLIARKLGLYDTYAIQIIPWAASVFGIFLVRQFFTSLPTDILEAAELDGAGVWRMLWSIGTPLAKAPLALVALNSFMGTWNSFVWPYIMTKRDEIRPIEVGMETFYSANGTDWTVLCAAITFTTLPVIAVFVFLNKYFVKGMSGFDGAVRG